MQYYKYLHRKEWVMAAVNLVENKNVYCTHDALPPIYNLTLKKYKKQIELKMRAARENKYIIIRSGY